MGEVLTVLLQPLVDLGCGQVVGHEALLRGPAGTTWESPTALFRRATQLGERATLDAIARRLALARWADLPAGQRLFLNVDVASPQVPAMPGHPAVHPEQVVLELPEHVSLLEPVWRQRIAEWRAAGHPIALDDYGAGYMALGVLVAVQPDVVKIDRQVIAGLDGDRRRQAVVRHLAALCQDLAITVVAEGIETQEELWALQDLGIGVGQGFLLGRPTTDPVESVQFPPRPARPDRRQSHAPSPPSLLGR